MRDKAFVFRIGFLMWRISGVGFEWNILLKGVCKLDFEERKGCENML